MDEQHPTAGQRWKAQKIISGKLAETLSRTVIGYKTRNSVKRKILSISIVRGQQMNFCPFAALACLRIHLISGKCISGSESERRYPKRDGGEEVEGLGNRDLDTGRYPVPEGGIPERDGGEEE